jgi:hypothetical protein
MAGTATRTPAGEAEKLRSPGKVTKAARREVTSPPPEQVRQRAKTPPRRRPAATSRPQPRVARPPATTAKEPSASLTPPITQAQALQELVRRANEGNATCLAGLRRTLDNNPPLWRAAGDVSALAERHWIELLACGNKLAEESIPRRLRELKDGLAGPDPTSLEALLIDVIGVNWLAAQHGEIAAAQAGGSIQQATFRHRRAESCQRRLIKAIKALAMVRALWSRAAPMTALDPGRDVGPGPGSRRHRRSRPPRPLP